jgi:hypothetical protein
MPDFVWTNKTSVRFVRSAVGQRRQVGDLEDLHRISSNMSISLVLAEYPRTLQVLRPFPLKSRSLFVICIGEKRSEPSSAPQWGPRELLRIRRVALDYDFTMHYLMRQRHRNSHSSTCNMDGMTILCDVISAQPDFQASRADSSATQPYTAGPISSGRTAKPGRRKQHQETLDHPDAIRSHRCRICNRTYERIDHLSRHLRSHENARPFKCSHCPKRFNRQDLLNRHATVHERDIGGEGSPKPLIRRTDRATSACATCAATKVKCENEKPCRRCRNKNITCQSSNDVMNRGRKVSSVGRNDISVSHLSGETIAPSSESGGSQTLIEKAGSSDVNEGFESNALDGTQLNEQDAQIGSFPTNSHMYSDDFPLPAEGFQMNDPSRSLADNMQYTVNPESLIDEDLINDVVFFPNVSGFNQDVDIGFWDFPVDDFPIDAFEVPHCGGENRQQPTPENSQVHENPKLNRDIARGYAAFKRSPWLWTPAPKDMALNDQSDLNIDEDQVTNCLTPSSIVGHKPFEHIKLDSLARDRMFALVVSTNRNDKTVPGFPNLELLNQLLQNYFVRESYLATSWIHIPSFDPTKCPPHLLISLVSAGSTLVSVPAIWKLGLALLEIARLTIADLVGPSLSNNILFS